MIDGGAPVEIFYEPVLQLMDTPVKMVAIVEIDAFLRMPVAPPEIDHQLSPAARKAWLGPDISSM